MGNYQTPRTSNLGLYAEQKCIQSLSGFSWCVFVRGWLGLIDADNSCLWHLAYAKNIAQNLQEETPYEIEVWHYIIVLYKLQT